MMMKKTIIPQFLEYYMYVYIYLYVLSPTQKYDKLFAEKRKIENDKIQSEAKADNVDSLMRKIKSQFICPTCLEAFIDEENETCCPRKEQGNQIGIYAFNCCGHIICSNCVEKWKEKHSTHETRAKRHERHITVKRCMYGCHEKIQRITLTKIHHDMFA